VYDRFKTETQGMQNWSHNSRKRGEDSE
jgi:hypothetical protein